MAMHLVLGGLANNWGGMGSHTARRHHLAGKGYNWYRKIRTFVPRFNLRKEKHMKKAWLRSPKPPSSASIPGFPTLVENGCQADSGSKKLLARHYACVRL